MYMIIDSNLEYGLELELTQLNDRNRHDSYDINKETKVCRNCGQQSIIETIEVFILDCTTYNSRQVNIFKKKKKTL